MRQARSPRNHYSLAKGRGKRHLLYATGNRGWHKNQLHTERFVAAEVDTSDDEHAASDQLKP